MTQMNTQFKAGEKNDPSVTIGAPEVNPALVPLLRTLGFKESLGGSYVYHSGGRAIWVNNAQTGEDITNTIIASAEAIGKRTKINEIRQVLDMPFGEVAVVKASHE